MQQFLDDLRQAARGLTRARGFTATAALTLALGIGAVTALTSVLDLLLFRPPVGVTAPERVTRLLFHFKNPQFGEWTNPSVSYPDFTDLQKARGFQALAAQARDQGSLGRGAEARSVSVAEVTGGYFGLLGATPMLGRLLVPEDDRVDGPTVVVLSERLWRTGFGSDPAIVGRTLPLNDRVFTVVGVAPKDFDGGDLEGADLWVPLSVWSAHGIGGNDFATDRGWYWVQLSARLADGVTLEQAAAEATALVRAGREEAKETNGFSDVQLAPALESASPITSAPTELAQGLAAMSLLVLLIACANVANLLLARGLVRAREFAVRKALGAGQGRLVRQLLLEGGLIALVGGAAGLLVATWGGALLAGTLLTESMAERLRIDPRVLMIAGGATLLAALVSSLLPALALARGDLTPVLKEGGRAGYSRSRLRAGLVVAQVALSVVLVVGAGLFVRSLRNVLGIDIGYDREHIILVDADPRDAGFDGLQTGQAFDAMLAAALVYPGVESGALNNGEPFGWSMAVSLRIPGLDSLPRFSSGGPYIQQTTADYFRTMGLPLLRGRGFTDADRRAQPPVAVLGATMAERYFPGQDPIGKCLIIGGAGKPCTEIIGIAKNGVRYSPREEPQAIYYVPLAPTDTSTRHLTLFLRTRGPARDVVAGLRVALQTAAPGLPYVTARSLDEVLAPRYQSHRLGASLFGLYALAALGLAGLGLYAVLAYTVRGRRQELGVRLALGAAPGSLVRLVMGDAFRLVLLGIVAGLVGAVAAGRALASQLYGVKPADPAILLGSALVLGVLTVVASLLPARRAARTDPMTALRSE